MLLEERDRLLAEQGTTTRLTSLGQVINVQYRGQPQRLILLSSPKASRCNHCMQPFAHCEIPNCQPITPKERRPCNHCAATNQFVSIDRDNVNRYGGKYQLP
jgi:hypothetical protein